VYYFFSYDFISTLPRICFNCPSHAYLCFVQMAAPAPLVFDEEGRAHSDCTHWEGFPSILLECDARCGISESPTLRGRGVPRAGSRALLHAADPCSSPRPSSLALCGARGCGTQRFRVFQSLTQCLDFRRLASDWRVGSLRWWHRKSRHCVKL